MSKIICDVCGTAYPETATQCPICGFAKPADEQVVPEEASTEEVTYIPTKGGRFSRRNVRRRNRKSTQENRSAAAIKSEESEESTNVGLIIVVIALLLAIIAVVIYIGIRFFAPGDAAVPATKPSESQTQPQTEGSMQIGIPCTDLSISVPQITFATAGNAWMIEVTPHPADTTDTVTFSSGNEKVAIVSETGKVTSIGGGETVITIKCGDITKECKITCTFEPIEDPVEDETEHVTSAPIDPNFEFKFNAPDKYRDPDTGKWDTTITTPNSTWRAYKKDITVYPQDIIWTSDDPAIASVKDGIVTALTPGVTEIHAQYGDKIYTCIVRCVWKVESTDNETDETETEEIVFAFNTPFKDGEKWDLTMAAGKTWRAYKLLDDLKTENITWSVDDATICTIDDKGVVTMLAKGTTEIHAEYEGITYTCIVRVTE